jgi:hypothetical protein
MDAFTRDFRHTFNEETKQPWGGTWSASQFYEKHHLLIAVLTRVHLGQIKESNLIELYKLAKISLEKTPREGT